MLLGCCVSLQEIQLVEQAGFDFIELQVGTIFPEKDDSYFQSVRVQIEECSLPVKSFNAFLPPQIRIVGKDVRREIYEKYVLTALHRMKELGAETVSFGSGGSRSCPIGFPREKAMEQLLQFLEFTASAASRMGIQINIEGLNRTECNMINSLLDAKKIVEVINLPNVTLLADFYHMQMENEPTEHLFQVKDKLHYVHVADSGRLYPGSGKFPFLNLMNTLQKIEYDGPISIECTWKNPEKEIPLAHEFLTLLMN